MARDACRTYAAPVARFRNGALSLTVVSTYKQTHDLRTTCPPLCFPGLPWPPPCLSSDLYQPRLRSPCSPQTSAGPRHACTRTRRLGLSRLKQLSNSMNERRPIVSDDAKRQISRLVTRRRPVCVFIPTRERIILYRASTEFYVDGRSIPDVDWDVGPSWSGLLPISNKTDESRKVSIPITEILTPILMSL